MSVQVKPQLGAEHQDQLSPGVVVRKWVSQVEEILRDGERPNERPLRRVVVAAVISNPYAGKWSGSLDKLIDADELLIALAVTDRPRPHARVGGLRAEDAQGADGVVMGHRGDGGTEVMGAQR